MIVRFHETDDGVGIEGFEEIGVRWLFFLPPPFERVFLERGFQAIWRVGWQRLRRSEGTEGAAPTP